jgi:DNA-binding transcriptional regulator YiaG
VVKNLTEATQLLLARSQGEIAAASMTEEPFQSDQNKPVISVEEWRPAEPAHVKKVRLTRRAGRYERYQQVVQLQEQGMKPKEIAKLLDMGERTVRDWLKGGSFPEAKKRRKRQSGFDPFAPYVLKRGPRRREKWPHPLQGNQGTGLHRNGANRLPSSGNAQASRGTSACFMRCN